MKKLRRLDPIPDGFVYLIECPGLSALKIGFSKRPETRLATLQTANPERLYLIGVSPGDFALEGDLHHLFREHHLKNEWFYDAKAIRDFFIRAEHDVMPFAWRLMPPWKLFIIQIALVITVLCAIVDGLRLVLH